MILSVIIPCRNELSNIEECIQAIYQNDLDIDVQLNIIVVDGMSEDGNRTLVEQLKLKNSNLYIIDNIDKVTPLAFNLGIKFLKSDFYQIVGAKQILSINYLQKAINVLTKTLLFLV
tara:strand:+ start:77 stop:427 length:351 start_codon:yes stop_codon:yes gene_type:complete